MTSRNSANPSTGRLHPASSGSRSRCRYRVGAHAIMTALVGIVFIGLSACASFSGTAAAPTRTG